jgi:hypothetical protein
MYDSGDSVLAGALIMTAMLTWLVGLMCLLDLKKDQRGQTEDNHIRRVATS